MDKGGGQTLIHKMWIKIFFFKTHPFKIGNPYLSDSCCSVYQYFNKGLLENLQKTGNCFQLQPRSRTEDLQKCLTGRPLAKTAQS